MCWLNNLQVSTREVNGNFSLKETNLKLDKIKNKVFLTAS